MKTDDETLARAMRRLSVDIVSVDGVANAAIDEAACRIEELAKCIEDIRDAVLYERFQLSAAGLDCDQVNAVLGIIDDNDARVFSKPEEGEEKR